MKLYDGIQPMLTEWDKAIFDAREDEIVDILLDLDRGIGTSGVYIGEVREYDDEDHESTVAFYADFLCDMLEIPSSTWLDHFVRLDYESIRKSKVTDRSEMAQLARDLSIGQFVTQFSYRLLPIECDESGDMWLDMQLASSKNVKVLLRVSGDFSTAYPEFEGDESSIDYTIRFYANITPPNSLHNSV